MGERRSARSSVREDRSRRSERKGPGKARSLQLEVPRTTNLKRRHVNTNIPPGSTRFVPRQHQVHTSEISIDREGVTGVVSSDPARDPYEM